MDKPFIRLFVPRKISSHVTAVFLTDPGNNFKDDSFSIMFENQLSNITISTEHSTERKPKKDCN